MRTEYLPPSLREAAHELVEKMNARQAILRYERSKSPLYYSAEQSVFEARLEHELHELEEVWIRVYNAWSKGQVSVVMAVTLLRLPPTTSA